MSRTRSASTGHSYGRPSGSEGVGPAAGDVLPAAPATGCTSAARTAGPTTHYSDEQLVGETRRAIQESPFHGEGHRRVCAPPRRTHFPAARAPTDARARVARRRSASRNPSSPDATMWGIDSTAAFTLRDAQVPIFAMIDHGSACCLGIHVAKRGTRFEALEPVRQAVREQFGDFSEGIAPGVKLRHNHGSQFMSDDFQREICFPGLVSSPAFVREPEGNSSIERFFPHSQGAATLGAPFQDRREVGRSARTIPPALQRAVAGRTPPLPFPAAGSRGFACPGACRITIIQKTVQEIGRGTPEMIE
ncbi:MAG: hypothetical protein KatS3mg082_2853 [Nitrospiraceae bacterium]|nr:MAG: hypothetical protein KatS3mg082_2853 [Nitrospiraceae bacterium]